MKKLAILLDSGSTINQTYFSENDIFVVPLAISDLNNKTYLDTSEEIGPEYVFSEIKKGNSFKTSCTAMGVLINKVEDLLKSYEKVLMIPISEGLSGQYNMAKNVEREFPNSFFVAKTSSAAFANEYIAIKTKKYFEENNGCSMEELANYASSLYAKTATYFSCEDPAGLAKSGRASKAIVKVFEVLKLKPLVCLEYKNHLAGIGKNYKTITEKILKALKKDFGAKLKQPDFIESLCIYLGGYLDEKKAFLLEKFSTSLNFPKSKINFRWVPTCVLTHTREGSYGITLCCQESHKERKHED